MTLYFVHVMHPLSKQPKTRLYSTSLLMLPHIWHQTRNLSCNHKPNKQCNAPTLKHLKNKANEKLLKLRSVNVTATTTMKERLTEKPTWHPKKKGLSHLFEAHWWFSSWRNTSRCRGLLFVWALTGRAESEGKSKDTLKAAAAAWCQSEPVIGHGGAQIAAEYTHKVTLWSQTHGEMTEMGSYGHLWFLHPALRATTLSWPH